MKKRMFDSKLSNAWAVMNSRAQASAGPLSTACERAAAAPRTRIKTTSCIFINTAEVCGH